MSGCEKACYAGIHLLDAPYTLDRPFDYLIPESLRGRIVPGVFVTVPFGNSNRKRIGIVVSTGEVPSCDPKSVKPLCNLCPGDLSLDAGMLALCAFVKSQTLCTIGDAVRAMVPAATLSKLTEIWSYQATADNEKVIENLPANELFVLEYLQKRHSAGIDTLRGRFGGDVVTVLQKLLSRQLVKKDIQLADQPKQPMIKKYDLAPMVTPEALKCLLAGQKVGGIAVRSLSEKQIAVLEGLQRLDGFGTAEEIDRECGFAAAAQLKTLTGKGILTETLKPLKQNPYAPDPHPKKPDYQLNDEQTAAYNSLCELADSGEPKAALLFGVTGSGKTCVMVKTIEHILAAGKSAIVLLPEIALTPQSVSIFNAAFGEIVAVIHSALTPNERRDAYLRIRRGEARVIVGTRSAVFAPVQNLGLIVIDEEQEHTYKSDINPKYHARDIARFRCASENALMLLASATPSVESYQKAIEGKYTLLKLQKRYGGAVLPRVEIVDMRGEATSGNITPLGTHLSGLLAEHLQKGEQAILFLNRRGYNHFLSCPKCGEAVRCPTCSVALTYHTNRNTYSEGRMVCHVCGRTMPVPTNCPNCGGEHLLRMGFGTQRVEQELHSLFPDAGVLRMDTDSTVTRFSCDEILEDFRNRRGQILLGTQMVTKGHDFPGVTLVGVLSADASLYLDDFRASERTFAMLTQVIGRAGRGNDPGIAVIQTSNPDNDIIKLACAQDYEAFFEREIRLRRALCFPPFCDIALLTLSGSDEKAVLAGAGTLLSTLQKRTVEGGEWQDVPLQLFGPFEAPIYRVENKYRMRVVAKCRLNKRTRDLFSHLLSESDGELAGLTLSADFNPTAL